MEKPEKPIKPKIKRHRRSPEVLRQIRLQNLDKQLKRCLPVRLKVDGVCILYMHKVKVGPGLCAMVDGNPVDDLIQAVQEEVKSIAPDKDYNVDSHNIEVFFDYKVKLTTPQYYPLRKLIDKYDKCHKSKHQAMQKKPKTVVVPPSPPKEEIVIDDDDDDIKIIKLTDKGPVPEPQNTFTMPHCIICFENYIDTVNVPCGHASLCMECVNKHNLTNNKCSICRTDVQSVNKLFISC